MNYHVFKEWMQELQVGSEVDAHDAPVMVMAGEVDSSWSVDALREVANVLAAKEFITFPGVGHTIPFEDAPAFNEALIGWLYQRF